MYQENKQYLPEGNTPPWAWVIVAKHKKKPDVYVCSYTLYLSAPPPESKLPSCYDVDRGEYVNAKNLKELLNTINPVLVTMIDNAFTTSETLLSCIKMPCNECDYGTAN